MLEVVGKENNDFIVKDSESGQVIKIVDTFAEMFHNNESLNSVLDKLPFFL